MFLSQLQKLARAIDRFNQSVSRLTAWLVLLMVGVGVWNVAGRYLGRWFGQNLTSNAAIEIQWYLFDLVFLLGAAYTLKRDAHVRVDIIYKQLSARGQAIADLLGALLFLLPFSAMVIFYSWSSVVNSWQIREISPDPGGLPRYPIKTVIIAGFVLLMLQGISQAIAAVTVLLQQGSSDD